MVQREPWYNGKNILISLLVLGKKIIKVLGKKTIKVL